MDKIANKYEVQPIALTTYQGIIYEVKMEIYKLKNLGITELSNSLNPVYFETKINVKRIQDSIMAKYARGVIFN